MTESSLPGLGQNQSTGEYYPDADDESPTTDYNKVQNGDTMIAYIGGYGLCLVVRDTAEDKRTYNHGHQHIPSANAHYTKASNEQLKKFAPPEKQPK